MMSFYAVSALSISPWIHHWQQPKWKHSSLATHFHSEFLFITRLNKEKGMYEKEVKDQETKVESMKAAGKDEHEIKQQV